MAARRARVLRDQQTGEHPQALRRHLIGVTQRLLAAHGLTGLTTRSIAREAQVSDGVLYNHFADKDDLVVAALAERVAELAARAVAACPRPGEQDLRTGLTTLVAICLDFQSAALPLIGGLITRPDLVRRLMERMHTGDGAPRRLWHAMSEYVAGEQELGTLSRDVDAETVGEVLFGTTHMHVLARQFAGVVDPAVPVTMPPRDRDRLITFLLRACAPGGPDPDRG
jgi:AcrR family transcriptional regulator